jgi:hypothetical protein
MMNHHGSTGAELPQPDREALNRLVDEIAGTAKREYPEGQISADDQGVTAFAIATDLRNQIIRIQFTKPMTWLGLGLVEARRLREILDEKIDELENNLVVPR